MSFLETMTPMERINSLHETGCADRPGISAFAMGMVPRMTYGLTVGEGYANPLSFAKAYLHIWQLFGFDNGPLFGHACAGNAEFGGTLAYPGKRSKANSPFIVNHAINLPEDVDRMTVPDPSTVGEVPKIVEACRYVFKEYPDGYRSPSVVVGTPFTWVVNIVGMETVLVWMIKSPELVYKLLNKVVEFQIEYAKYLVETLEPMVLFEGGLAESNDFISAKQFEYFVLPYLREYHAGAMKHGAIGINSHPCGDQTRNIKLWKELKDIRFINFDYRTPISRVVEEFHNDSTVVGNLEPFSFVSQDFDSIYSKTRESLHVAATKCNRGYVVGPGCEMPSSVPPANLFAMVQATRDYAESSEWRDHCRK
jgi:uroporphyrinogen decarboxylase